MPVKNTGSTALDCGGLMLPVGAVADLDPLDPVIADHLAAGRLTTVQGALAEPSPPPVPRQKSIPKES